MKALAALSDALFPDACVACGKVLSDRRYFCAPCDRLTETIPAAHCTGCGEPGVFPHRLCARCTKAPLRLSRAYAPFAHEGSMARAIHRFKYEDHPELARPLGQLLVESAHEFLASVPGVICPIPLHKKRYLSRKYDQATLLAVSVSNWLGRECRDELLTRTRATQRQVGLDDVQRRQNVRGAFASKPAFGLSVLLIDDVMTTGATADDAARALLEAGAAQVNLLTLARAHRDS